ncbi:DUF1697 domain-containing protein [Clostridioides difficile]|uniref:DUF1697 domain-containing protein n=1 Tax=Clostridioides difficile TaxID=1496 RepID=UPI000F60680E|nr:DUF1697 domain-containing protein [Clostridioides difficile]RRH26854.1 DUF1697 domain-containing protein [Clostridioides difficile]TOY59850.1 DUF1697 domain-containing protein [Clostridioides difficile]TQX06237.1 DUF1697 domain-containing protein [Clostridioides difficile]TQX36937.1 DUF1697 domain-containing protein [Clostridioides difficile]HBE9551194.1 DUF1697 domain-containing protein [Clostridioides difficile]
MKSYIALLRGINISGKNKIIMSELKASFVELGYSEVSTYLNSANVVFLSDVDDSKVISNTIRLMIKKQFELEIPVFIISQEELKDILNNAPNWWGDNNKEIYDNLIFMFPDLSYDEFYDEVGNPKEEYEKVYHYKNAIFWSFSRKDYKKTNWWSKTASSNVSDKITIRTANTVRKIVGMR